MDKERKDILVDCFKSKKRRKYKRLTFCLLTFFDEDHFMRIRFLALARGKH